jgi:hypothetical protein
MMKRRTVLYKFTEFFKEYIGFIFTVEKQTKEKTSKGIAPEAGSMFR